MKFTSEDLAKLLGIKIGDRIKYTNGEVADVIKDYILDFHPWRIGLHILVDEDFEILPQRKKVGDTICREICCYNCPLKMLDCPDNNNRTLFEKLEMVHEEYNDKEIYDILKARLDKEVE